MALQKWATGLSIAVLLTGCTVRISVDVDGGDPDSSSVGASTSAHGRFVAFTSLASDLIEGDTNALHDIYRRDTKENRTVRVSVDKDGGDPNFDSFNASISANGNKIAFESLASDLVDADTKGQLDVFVRDVRAQLTSRASVGANGEEADSHSTNPDISANGRYVAFSSAATNLVPADGNGFVDIYVRDLVDNTTARASVDTAGGDPNNSSLDPSISADGRYVAFLSYASDLVALDGNGKPDIFVRDLVAGTTTRVSVDTGGGDANDRSQSPDISANGHQVAFASLASDLVSNDRNVCLSEGGPTSCSDIFVRPLISGTTVRVSVDASGSDANYHSGDPSISGDGSRVAFSSGATDLVVGDENETEDVFLRDLKKRATARVSVDAGSGDPNSSSRAPAISADGETVAFESFASDLVDGDGNGTVDIFVVPAPR